MDRSRKKYSEKVRAMLAEYLDVTGLKTMCKLRSLSPGGGGEAAVEPLRRAALAIDGRPQTATPHSQDNAQLKKSLRGRG